MAAEVEHLHHDHDHARMGHVHTRPDSHAPVGVMGDHVHAKGEWMVSVRSMHMKMDGHREGTRKLSTHEVFERGYSSAATEMEMDMQMLGFMYAPSDKVTLMAMANYVSKDMDMVSQSESMHGDMGMGDAMGHHGTATMMSHSTSGWGDLSVGALVNVLKGENGSLHLNLGLSAPTGSVDEMMHGMFQPYGMQLGSGTWDSKVGATFVSKQYDSFSWGAQTLGTIRLEDEGSSGFARADALEVSVWSSWVVSKSMSIAGRLKYSGEGALTGHYNGPHGHSAPPHLQRNYGGDILEASLSLNYVFQDGALEGNRLGVEFSAPVRQELNGVGMNREETLTLGWFLAW